MTHSCFNHIFSIYYFQLWLDFSMSVTEKVFNSRLGITLDTLGLTSTFGEDQLEYLIIMKVVKRE
jgi:hypothetical protein